jgi:hypothetical protein
VLKAQDLAPQGLKVLKDLLVQQVDKGSKVLKVLKVQQVLQVQQVHHQTKD